MAKDCRQFSKKIWVYIFLHSWIYVGLYAYWAIKSNYTDTYTNIGVVVWLLLGSFFCVMSCYMVYLGINTTKNSSYPFDGMWYFKYPGKEIVGKKANVLGVFFILSGLFIFTSMSILVYLLSIYPVFTL